MLPGFCTCRLAKLTVGRPREENQRLRGPMKPSIGAGFEIARNNFNQWLCIWKMRFSKGNRDLLKFFQKTKNGFINICENEVEDLKSVKFNLGFL